MISGSVEILSEDFTVTVEIARLLDEFGRPGTGHDEEYVRLSAQKDELQATLDAKIPDHETIELKSILNEAFSDQ